MRRGCARLFQERRCSDKKLCAGIFQLMSSFLSRVERIECRVDSAKHRYSVKCDGVLRTVRAEDPKHVAFLESSARQGGRHAAHSICELAVSDRTSGRPIDECNFLLEFRYRF